MEVLYTWKSRRFCWELDPSLSLMQTSNEKLFKKDQCTMILVRD